MPTRRATASTLVTMLRRGRVRRRPVRKARTVTPTGAPRMKMQQVGDNCFAVLNEKNRVCDANSGLINRGGGVVIDTQSDLAHARRMIAMFGKVWPAMPRRV